MVGERSVEGGGEVPGGINVIKLSSVPERTPRRKEEMKSWCWRREIKRGGDDYGHNSILLHNGAAVQDAAALAELIVNSNTNKNHQPYLTPPRQPLINIPTATGACSPGT